MSVGKGQTFKERAIRRLQLFPSYLELEVRSVIVQSGQLPWQSFNTLTDTSNSVKLSKHKWTLLSFLYSLPLNSWHASYPHSMKNDKLLGSGDSRKQRCKNSKSWQKFYFQATHWGKNQLFTQKFPRIWCLKIVNFVKNDILKMWILWKLDFEKCEFCENWHF